MNYEGVCRTAPATRGLLIILKWPDWFGSYGYVEGVNKGVNFARGLSYRGAVFYHFGYPAYIVFIYHVILVQRMTL